MFTFNSKMRLGDKLTAFTNEQLKYETMFFGADFEFAMKHGGEPTKQFLLSLPEEWQDKLILDSRVHMLMPKWFPCIPGFHFDSVPRTREDGQPDHASEQFRSQHAMCLYNGEICPTEFALGQADFEDVPLGQICYKVWHPKVVEHLAAGTLKSWSAEPNRVIYFDDRTWHQGTKAVKNGWRMFLRASINDGRKPMNEIRRQVQVYLEYPMEGW